jgi:SAM-dependent methyltransferase
MRLLAERVGRDGLVVGVDTDRTIGEQAIAALHARGHRQCEFEPLDVATARVPGGPYDVVFVRLLLLHVDEPVEVLGRLWDYVAPGGVLVVQEYDLLSGGVVPELDTVTTLMRVIVDTFRAAGRELRAGPALPALFAAAGIGAPDGLEAVVRAGLLPELAPMYEAIFASILPAALALDVTTEEEGAAWFEAFARDSGAGASAHAALWPTLVGGWRRKR